MADKEWEDMTLEEKCDNLRRNQEHLYGIASRIATDVMQMRNHLNPTITEIGKAVERLEARMRALDGK